MLTPRESRYFSEIADRVSRARDHINGGPLEDRDNPAVWYAFLSSLRQIQGNLSNDLSFVATLLAKRYLKNKFGVDFDAAEKPQGAPGIDIDIQTTGGQRIVGEIKTTVPYQDNDFGAQQAASFKKDFVKLSAATATHKFLFVTEPRAFSVIHATKYTKLMPGCAHRASHDRGRIYRIRTSPI